MNDSGGTSIVKTPGLTTSPATTDTYQPSSEHTARDDGAAASPWRWPWQFRYRFVRWRWHVLFYVLDSLGWFARLVAFPRRPRSALVDPRKILVIQLDHLGDAVITAAVLPALARRFPRARITVLAADCNREVFEAASTVAEVLISRRNRFSRTHAAGWPLAMIWWGIALRPRKFDLVIDMRGEFPLALVAWLSGTPHRLGWESGGGSFLLSRFALHQRGRPEIESRLELLKLVGVEALANEQYLPWLSPPTWARHSIVRRLESVGFRGRPLVVLHVGAGTPAKRWPVDHWRELLGRLLVEFGARVVLAGGPKERATAAEILREPGWPNTVDWTAQLTLMETAALIQSADLFVGPDSGPAHLAAAVGTRAVVLFSGTNSARQWRPRGQAVLVARHEVSCSPCYRSECLWPDHPCMRGLAPVVVMRSVRQLLSGQLRSDPETKVVIPALDRRLAALSDFTDTTPASFRELTP